MTNQPPPARPDGDALSEHCDRAYDRLLALCGTRNDAPRWDDIATLLRERERLYLDLRLATYRAREAAEGGDEARDIVTEWLGMFDPPPQIDFQQSELLQGAIASALGIARAGKAYAPPKPAPDAVREAQTIIRGLLSYADGHELRGSWAEELSALKKRASEFLSAPVPPADGARCSCGPMCQDLGKAGGCRYLQPARALLRRLVDDVWQHATESKAVPSTDVADKLIDDSFIDPSATGAAEPVAAWMCRSKGKNQPWGEWLPISNEEKNKEPDDFYVYEYRPLYATPPVRGGREAIALLLAKFDDNSDGTIFYQTLSARGDSYFERADAILSRQPPQSSRDGEGR